MYSHHIIQLSISEIQQLQSLCAPLFQNYTNHNDIDFFVLLESPWLILSKSVDIVMS
jgi:hypothetical protein